MKNNENVHSPCISQGLNVLLNKGLINTWTEAKLLSISNRWYLVEQRAGFLWTVQTRIVH